MAKEMEMKNKSSVELQINASLKVEVLFPNTPGLYNNTHLNHLLM